MRTVTILPATFAIVATMALATPFEANAAMQCVTYARDVSGLQLKGDAWKWWEAAAGVYDRGHRPREGAVLVFKRQGKMSHGHVSVVRQMKNSRELLVDHANWAPHRSPGRGKVTQAVPVIDVSPNNDWSQVRVFYRPAGELGTRVYQTQGFVYRSTPSTPPRGGMMAQPTAASGRADGAPLLQTVALADTAAATPALMRVESIPAKAEPPAAAPVKTPEPAPVIAAPAPVKAPAPAIAAPAQVIAAPAAASAPVQARPAEPGRVDVSRWAEQA